MHRRGAGHAGSREQDHGPVAVFHRELDAMTMNAPRAGYSPGSGVKRWLLVVFAGMLLLALGVAHVLRQVTRDLEPAGPRRRRHRCRHAPVPAVRAARVHRRRGRSRAWSCSARTGVARALTEPLRRADAEQPLVEVIYQKRFLARGPRIVAIGGGTGLSTLLRGLKEHTSNLTAVVTVADDGGSSGVLREELGIPPVGDIRNCIAALADAEPLMSELLRYRFPASRGDAASASRRAWPATPSATC